MSEPTAHKCLTEKDLRATGWEQEKAWPYGTFWSHPAVRDGQPMIFAEAARAEETGEEKNAELPEKMRSKGGFRWCWPRMTVYTPADRRPCIVLNRYYLHHVIGIAVVVFGRCWSLQWKRG